jgi:hypothetical protein
MAAACSSSIRRGFARYAAEGDAVSGAASGQDEGAGIRWSIGRTNIMFSHGLMQLTRLQHRDEPAHE